MCGCFVSRCKYVLKWPYHYLPFDFIYNGLGLVPPHLQFCVKVKNYHYPFKFQNEYSPLTFGAKF